MQWTVGSRGEPAKPARKVPYTSKYRIKDDTPADQKQTMERWNLMVDALKELGAMEENQKK